MSPYRGYNIKGYVSAVMSMVQIAVQSHMGLFFNWSLKTSVEESVITCYSYCSLKQSYDLNISLVCQGNPDCSRKCSWIDQTGHVGLSGFNMLLKCIECVLIAINRNSSLERPRCCSLCEIVLTHVYGFVWVVI